MRSGWGRRFLMKKLAAKTIAAAVTRASTGMVAVTSKDPLAYKPALGWYDAARKWVDALNIVPQFFTLAVFPVMARQAAQESSPE